MKRPFFDIKLVKVFRMRIRCSFLAFCLMSLGMVYAQKDVTQFLGIPVDGSKAEMVQKIKAKGFTQSIYNEDALEGEFNGYDVRVYVSTNRGKVCRIMVCDVNTVDERSIQIRFNRLCRQFEKNSKYLSLDDYTIPDDENISYEMMVHKKRYDALFYQQPLLDALDTAEIQEKILSELQNKYTSEQISTPTDEIMEEVNSIAIRYAMDLMTKKAVWFTISEYKGKYYITMYYDNEYNRADGEDL